MHLTTPLLLASLAFFGTVLARRGCGKTHWTTQDVRYLEPGQGACSYYTDSTLGVCMNPTCVNNKNRCGRTLWVATPDGSLNVTDVQVVDKCGGVFDCDSLWVTKSLFTSLNGDFGSGHIDQLQWGFQCDDDDDN
ncbi:hypothetical protein OC846_005375 [Tilletia horrida]|uniref:Barwin domain-containing protein n=1 Tax=Tilletia horrida TaxID=155126 RepID=A0AAN6GN39_9BASI|nr:hypothetical protein OC846_005375 [Tilletia horrida]KAK0549420.1 hypothetical protein OC845_003125 [Tilletia horrida]KAK0561956.1 hypothetical protein OC861_005554 [Tilletia horrida]